jgi:predicted nucleic acid-binding protein
LVIFWDTSAVVRLLVAEPASSSARELLARDSRMLVWWATPVECLAALARREHDGLLARDAAEQLRQDLSALAASWSEVQAGELVREHAGRLLLRHRLRAADALQLAAALVWAQGRPRGHRIATFDRRLGDAARGEGFRLALPAPAAAADSPV